MNGNAANCNVLMTNEQTNYRFIKYAECCFEVSQKDEATILATLQSAEGAENAGCIVYLQMYDGDWTTIKMWEKNCKGGYVTFFNTVQLKHSETYRVQVYFSVNKGAYTERLQAEETRTLDN